MNVVDNLNYVQVINKPCMRSRCMSLLPRTTLHSDSEQQVLTLSTSGEGPTPCSSGYISATHQSLLHCTLSLAIHFNGSNGIAYTRLSKVQNIKSHILRRWHLPPLPYPFQLLRRQPNRVSKTPVGSELFRVQTFCLACGRVFNQIFCL